MNNFNEVLAKMTEFLKTEAKTETIVGEQFKLGDFTCVPIMHIGLGFGGGEGEGKGDNSKKGHGEGFGAGAAAGIGMGPVGFLIAKGTDIRFVPTTSSKGLAVALEKLPDLVSKYLDQTKMKKRTFEKTEA